MNIEIAIIDDEKIIRETYEKYVLKWAQKNNISCKISLFESSEEFIFNYEDYKNFNILLLDIEMKEINGVELAKKIRNKDKNIQIIFISGYSEYIGEGYDVEALNFLVKPIREDKLFDVLNRAIERSETRKKYILIKEKDEQIKIYLDDIVYIVSDRNYVIIYGLKDEWRCRNTLTDMEEMLDKRFLKLSRSEIINLEYIERMSKTAVEMTSGIKLFIPRGKFQEINRHIIENF